MDELFEELPDFGQAIPDLLRSEYRKGPFERCIKCDRSLTDIAGFYEIQKVFKHNRPIWEHAICSDCGEDLVREYSETSRSRIQNFMSGMELHTDLEDCCHRCEESIDRGKEHMMTALCRKDKMLFSPVILCLDCLDEMNELLSRETRDSWGEFMEENVPGLPAQETPSPEVLPSLG